MTESYLNEYMGIHYDPALAQTKVQTIPYHVHSDTEDNVSVFIILVADIGDTNTTATEEAEISYYLWITYTADQWGEFERALSVHGASMNVERHTSTIRSAVYSEAYSITLSRSLLELREQGGFDLMLLGKDRTASVSLPSLYISTFLQRVHRLKSTDNTFTPKM